MAAGHWHKHDGLHKSTSRTLIRQQWTGTANYTTKHLAWWLDTNANLVNYTTKMSCTAIRDQREDTDLYNSTSSAWMWHLSHTNKVKYTTQHYTWWLDTNENMVKYTNQCHTMGPVTLSRALPHKPVEFRHGSNKIWCAWVIRTPAKQSDTKS